MAKEKALSDQLQKENDVLKAQIEKLTKERVGGTFLECLTFQDDAYKYKTIFEEECRKLVREEVTKIQKSITPGSSRKIRNISFLVD